MGRTGDKLYLKVRANQRIKRAPCWLCHQPINYAIPDDDPSGNGFSYDHAKPWSTHPDLRNDPANGRSAHLRCNKSRGAKEPPMPIAATSEAW